MTDQELRKYVDCGLVEEDEFAMFKEIMQRLAPQILKERRLAMLLFYHKCGELTAQEYEQAKASIAKA